MTLRNLTRISISFRSLSVSLSFSCGQFTVSPLGLKIWAEGNISPWPEAGVTRQAQKNSFTELKIGRGLAVVHFLWPRCGCGVWLLQLCLSHEIWVDWAAVAGSACRPSVRFCDGKRRRARRHQHQLALIRRPGLAGVAATFMSGILMPTECWDTAAVTTELTSGVGRGRGLGNYKCLMCPMSRYITTAKDSGYHA